jgi:predicted ATPase
MIAVAGEAGLGKTALVDDFVQGIGERQEARIARGRCSERFAGSEAYLPVLEALDGLLRGETQGGVSRILKALAPNWYVQLMSQPAADPAAARAASEEGAGSQQRMKREMAAFLQEASQVRPIVLLLDDVHWADVSTVDLLAYLADRLGAMKLLVIVTYRPSDLAQQKHPFLSLKLDLQGRRVCREVVLDCLSRDAVARYIDLEFPDHAFPADFAGLIHARTEGHTLFVVDLLRDLRRRRVIREDARPLLAEPLSDIARELPESVRSMIERKLGGLGASGQRLLAAAAVQGYDFDSAILAHTLDLQEPGVEDELARLEREHAIIRFVDHTAYPDGSETMRYRFTHGLYQNALYGSLGVTRRASLAGAVATALIRRWAERSPEVAHDLAVLFETARAPLMAARYFSLAAQSAARLFAHDEAGTLARRGLGLLSSVRDDAARRSVELELQMTRALAVKTTGGYAVPEVGAAYNRARELCSLIDDPAQVIPVLIGLSAHYITAGDIRAARGIADQLLGIAEQVGNPHLRMIAEWSLGAALHHLGELPAAHAHLSRALDLYDPQYHEARAWEVGIDPGVFCMCETSRTLWMLGRPDQSLVRHREAEARARASGHPQSLAFVLLFRMLLCHLRREPAPAHQAYVELVALCEAKGIAQEMLWARSVHGWALFELGHTERGLAEIDAGLADQDRVHAELLRPYYLMLQADALARAGHLDRAWANLARAGELSDATGQFIFQAELHRIRGELMLARDRDRVEDAHAEFDRALAVARQQQALSLELRAARSLAALLLARGRSAEARRALEPVYVRFEEGRDTRDLADARALLWPD